MHSGEEFRSARQAHDIDSSLQVRCDSDPSPVLTFPITEKYETWIVQYMSIKHDLLDPKSPASPYEMKLNEKTVSIFNLFEFLEFKFSKQFAITTIFATSTDVAGDSQQIVKY